jgi:hypothetical protein
MSEYEPNAALMNEGVGHIPPSKVEGDIALDLRQIVALRQIVWLLTGMKRTLTDVELALRGRR